MKNKVSIIIPVYNVVKYLTTCLESVVKQSYSNIEIILVDDGSTDGSGDICDKFKDTYPQVYVVHKENGGQASARNMGLNIATGDYIIFVDSDDYIAQNTAEYLMHIETLTNADIVQFKYIETEQTEKCVKVPTSEQYELINDRKVFFDKLYEIGGEAVSPCTKLYKREVFNDIRFREGMVYEDEYIIPYLLQKAKSIAYIPEIMYFYVMRDGSTIRSHFNRKKLDVFVYEDDRIRILRELGYCDILQKEYQRQVSNMIHMFYEAYGTGHKDEAKKIMNRLKNYTRLKLSMDNRFDGIIYKLCRINVNNIYLFYAIDRIRHREKYNGTDMEKSN